MRDLVTRRQPWPGWRRILVSGLGGAATIAVIALLSELTSPALLAAAFGASCVIVFTAPEAPLSQPVNVVGGHLVSAACGLAAASLLPAGWWSTGLAVGLAAAAMAALRVTHPPAGASPVAVALSGASWEYLLLPILFGSMLVVLAGVLVHRSTGTVYPVVSTAERG